MDNFMSIKIDAITDLSTQPLGRRKIAEAYVDEHEAADGSNTLRTQMNLKMSAERWCLVNSVPDERHRSNDRASTAAIASSGAVSHGCGITPASRRCGSGR